MINAVKSMPYLPQPFSMRDWRQTARDYDRLVFDWQAEGDFLPLPWMDEDNPNTGKPVFGLPSYVNSRRRRQKGTQEGVNCIAAVLSASLCGIDKEHQGGFDYVSMLDAFFNSANGENLFLNTVSCHTGQTFWYETYPNVLMTMLAELYPREWLLKRMEQVAERFLGGVKALGGTDADFNHTSFSYREGIPVYNGRWREPEAAAGYAFVLYTAYRRTGRSEFLEAGRHAMNYLERSADNPFYEILLPWAVLTAARMNAEQGCSYNIRKLVNWCFDGGSACRIGWGVVRQRWGETDCHGLCGSLADWGQRWDAPGANTLPGYLPAYSGYAFAANSFAMPAALVPAVRYDTRLADDIGKWMLNLANNARLFYPGAHPPKSQSCSFWDSDPYDCIAYEGLKKQFDGQSPYATGDPIRYAWGGIDLGLYGSSHAGLMACLLQRTQDEKILLLDCLRTDTAHAPAYPTYLIYNPYETNRTILLDLPEEETDLYDAAQGCFLEKGRAGQCEICLPAQKARVLVLAKPGLITHENGQLLQGGTVIDYNEKRE